MISSLVIVNNIFELRIQNGRIMIHFGLKYKLRKILYMVLLVQN